AALPEMHLHAFSPEEILYGSTRSGLPIPEYLAELKKAGLGTLPGTSAEVLDQDIRDLIARGRITVEQWIEVITSAHAQGIRNTQCSWVKEGPKLAQILLAAGANDMGGTLINESISTSAGASYGQLVAPAELRRLIRDAGRLPAQRTTTYDLLRVYEVEDAADDSPLDHVENAEARFGSYRMLASSGKFRFLHPTRVQDG